MSDPEVFICTKSQRVLLWSNGAGVIFDNQEKIRRHIPLPKLKFIRIATTQTQNRVNLFGRFSSLWLWQTLLFWAASYSPKKPESKRENCFQIRIIKACTTQSCIQLQSQKKSIRASRLYKQCLKLHGGMFCDTPNFKKYLAILCSEFESSKDSQNLNNPHTFLHSLLLKTCPENQFPKFWVEKKQVKPSVLTLNFSVLAPRSLKPK